MEYIELYSHERNYGCRIREYIYKGLKTITLENESIKVSILADKGSDIFEFVYKPKDVDVMWHSFNGIKSPEKFVPSSALTGGHFADYYEGGWQELFPNIGDDCIYKGAPLGGHGEVCHTSWEYNIELNEPEIIRVKFFIRTARMPYLLEKWLTIRTGDHMMQIDERVTNEGMQELQFMWGHHPAFGPIFLDESCIIKFPEGCTAKTHWNNLGEYAELPLDTEFKWPEIVGLDGKVWNLSKVPSISSKTYQMYYLYNIPIGWYKIKNQNKGITFEMRWDKTIFPFIWVWAPYGGCMDYPWFGRNYNLAIEPWSAIPHNLSKVAAENKGIFISPKQSISTTIYAGVYEDQV